MKVAVFIFLISFFIYFNSLQNDFLFDDKVIVKDNPIITSLKNIPKIFVSNYWANTPYENQVFLYRPLVISSFAIDYVFWGKNPYGFHLTNVLFHSINSVLIFFFVRGLIRGLSPVFSGTVPIASISVAFLSAFLFSVHTIHTEPVNMIVGRTELLSAFFILVSLIFLLKVTVPELGTQRSWVVSPTNTILSLLFFLFALLSKESSAVLPILIFILLVASPRSRRPRGQGTGFSLRKTIKNLLPFFVVFIIYFIFRSIVLKGIFSTAQSGIFMDKSTATLIFTMIKAFAYYLRLLVYPVGLSPDYPDFNFSYSLFDFDVIISCLIIFSVIVLVVAGFSLRSSGTVPILLIFIFLLPVSNIIPIGAILAERFLYFPSIGFCMFLSLIPSFVPLSFKLIKKVIYTIIILLGVWFAYLTVIRNFDWKNDEALWSKTLKYHPENVKAAYHIAEIELSKKNYDRAIELYEKSIKFYPKHTWNADKKSKANVYYKFGELYYKKENYIKSKENFNKCIELAPTLVDAYVYLGNCCVNLNELNEAVKFYEKALEIDKDSIVAKENLQRVKKYLNN